MFKTTTSLILLLIFVVTCSLSIILFFAAGWLYTYKVFTQETPVAEVTVSPLMEDENGTYFEVTIKEIKGVSPLTAMFSPEGVNSEILEEAETFKLYGDQIDIGGPTIKFKDFLYLFNFETVYKIAFVRAEYSEMEEEGKRTGSMTRRIDLNGGYSTWRSVQEDIQNNTFRGNILELFIDELPQINSRGVFVTDKEQNLILYVTEEGFLLGNKEN